MTKKFSSSFEPMQEQQLRSTFHDEALVPVDTEHAWRMMVSKYSISHSQIERGKPKFFQRWQVSTSRKSKVQRIRFAAVLVCVVISLMATTFAVASTSGEIVKIQSFLQHGGVPSTQYQNVQQKQQSNGVTITFNTAYADTNRIKLNFTTQLASTISKEYIGAFPPQTLDLMINGQKESLPIQAPINCSGNISQRSTSCNITVLPEHPFVTKNLDITWTVNQIVLVEVGKYLHDSPTLSGHWLFHFTTPVHNK